MTLVERELKLALSQLLPEAVLDWQNIPGTKLEGLLLTEDSGTRPLKPERVGPLMEAPPFWSLLWPAGHKLCQVFTSQPLLLSDRELVDIGCGSGLVACAAALAGARVLAVDSDDLSLLVTAVNRDRNQVGVELSDQWGGETQILILADFLYDDQNLSFLERQTGRSEEILVVDSRLKDLSLDGFECLGRYEGFAVPDLDPHREFAELTAWYYGSRFSEWYSAFEQKPDF